MAEAPEELLVCVYVAPVDSEDEGDVHNQEGMLYTQEELQEHPTEEEEPPEAVPPAALTTANSCTTGVATCGTCALSIMGSTSLW